MNFYGFCECGKLCGRDYPDVAAKCECGKKVETVSAAKLIMEQHDRIAELEAIIASGLSGEDKSSILKLLKLTAKSSRDMTGAELQAAREAAGLTVEQASHLIAHGFCCTPASVRGFLYHWEAFDGHVSADKFSPGLWDVIDKTYGLAREAAAEASAKGVKGE